MVRSLLILALSVAAASGAPPRYSFPADPSVLDAKRDLGAKGDGVADDTAALQKGLDLSCGVGQKTTKVLFLPDGTYRVTGTLVVKGAVGPWVAGESRDGVVIRLDDNAQGLTSLLRTHPSDSGETSADWFMRNFRNLTLDVGRNAGVDGVRWFSNNTGILQNVRVKGFGNVGVRSGFIGKSGPNLLEDVEVGGFATGIESNWGWGQTLARVTVRDCREVGLSVSANTVAAEDLVVERTPLPVRCDRPNDWFWWGGVLALRGGSLTGGDPAGPAIRNRSVLSARGVATAGSRLAIDGAAPVAGPGVAEYAHPPAQSLFGPPAEALRLPVEREPTVEWEADPAKWLCVDDFGAKAGDNADDTAAVQRALDAAAEQGKTVVTFRGCGGGDPNWYTIAGEVRVRAPVRLVLGLGFGRVLGEKGGRFVVDDASAPVVKFQNLDSFGGPRATLENRSKAHTLVAESCGVALLASGGGPLFATDCPAHLAVTKPDTKVWCRQLNPEGDSDAGLVTNAGGDLWILGLKFEGAGVRVRTSGGGRTEAMGVLNYGPGLKATDRRPAFDVEDASLSILGLRELNFGGDAYPVKVRERRGNVTRTWSTPPGEHGWIGWSAFSARRE